MNAGYQWTPDEALQIAKDALGIEDEMKETTHDEGSLPLLEPAGPHRSAAVSAVSHASGVGEVLSRPLGTGHERGADLGSRRCGAEAVSDEKACRHSWTLPYKDPNPKLHRIVQRCIHCDERKRYVA